MGVHTGDLINKVLAQTLTDREYQELRDMSLKVIRAVGETVVQIFSSRSTPRTGRPY